MPISAELLPIIAAPFIGSFLGVLVRRLPTGAPVAISRSRCDTCGTALSARDLVPLLSYAVTLGRCRYCGGPIGRFYPAIELAATALAISAVLAGLSWQACVLGWGLLALSWIDWEHMVLPDALTLPLIVAGLADVAVTDPDDVLSRAAGAIIGWAAFAAIAEGYRRLRGRDGLGGGDAKLLAVAGAWLGLEALPQVVTIAALSGIAWIGMAVLRQGRQAANQAFPFGPWIALAIWLIALLGGDS